MLKAPGALMVRVAPGTTDREVHISEEDMVLVELEAPERNSSRCSSCAWTTSAIQYHRRYTSMQTARAVAKAGELVMRARRA